MTGFSSIAARRPVKPWSIDRSCRLKQPHSATQMIATAILVIRDMKGPRQARQSRILAASGVRCKKWGRLRQTGSMTLARPMPHK